MVAQCGVQILCSSESKAVGFEFLPYCGLLCWGWGLWWNCIPAFATCFHVGLLSFTQCIGVIKTVFQFFSEKVFPYCQQIWCVLGRRWACNPRSSLNQNFKHFFNMMVSEAIQMNSLKKIFNCVYEISV